MENLDLSNYAAGYGDKTAAETAGQFTGMTPGSRISEEQMEAAVAAIPKETQELIEKEIMRQVMQIEPVYKLVHTLRVYVSRTLLNGIRGYAPTQVGFNLPSDEPHNISEMIGKVEQTAKFLNILFEEMRGMSTEITAAIRRMSLGLQTNLANFALKFKEYANGGELDRSSRSEFFRDLMDLQMFLGNEEINLELTRGKIK